MVYDNQTIQVQTKATKDLPYDNYRILRFLAWLVAVVVLMRVTHGWGFSVVFFVLFKSIYKKNNEMLFYTMLMAISFALGNSNIVIKAGHFLIMFRLLLISLSVCMIYRIARERISWMLAPFLGIFVYIIFMMFSSLYGWCPIISFQKLFFFSLVYLGYLGVVNSVIARIIVKIDEIRAIFLTMAVFFIVGSLLLIPFGIGYLTEENFLALKQGKEIVSLFSGISIQSQTLGPICSMLGVMLFLDLIFNIRKVNWLYLFLILCAVFLIWRTSSRTAMGALIAGMALAIFCLKHTSNISTNWKNKVYNIIIMIVIISSVGLLCIPQTMDKVRSFILKSSKKEYTNISIEHITFSRRSSWEAAIENFKMSPIIGNGFQVAKYMEDKNYVDNPVHSTIEKGTWVVAILEEGGIVGMVLFLLFAYRVALFLFTHKCYQGFCAFIMMLVINLGEFTLFSMTSVGGFLWAMVFISAIFDVFRIEKIRGTSSSLLCTLIG